MRRIGNQPTGFGGPGVREVRNRPTNSSHFKGGGCEAALQPQPSAPDGHAAQPAPRGRFHGQAHCRTRFGGRASREGDQEAEASHSVPSRMPNKRPAAAASSSRWVWTSRIVGGGNHRTSARNPRPTDQLSEDPSASQRHDHNRDPPQNRECVVCCVWVYRCFFRGETLPCRQTSPLRARLQAMFSPGSNSLRR